MRLPWQKREENTEATESMGDERYNQWDAEGNELDEEETTEQPEDELADLDDETRALFDRHAAKLVSEREAAIQARLQEVGQALTADGKVAILDPEKFGTLAKPFVAQPAVTAPPPPPPVPAAEGEEVSIPDPYTQPREFQAWLADQNKKVVAEALTAIEQRQQNVEAWRHETLADEAVRRGRQYIEASPQYQLLRPLLEHPDFDKAYAEKLRECHPEFLRDNDNLARVAGYVIGDIAPKLPQQRDEHGRYTSQRAVNAAALRDAYQPYPDSGRAPRGAPPSEDEVKMAQAAAAHTGRAISLDEVRVLGQGGEVTYEQYRQAKEAAARKGKK